MGFLVVVADPVPSDALLWDTDVIGRRDTATAPLPAPSSVCMPVLLSDVFCILVVAGPRTDPRASGTLIEGGWVPTTGVVFIPAFLAVNRSGIFDPAGIVVNVVAADAEVAGRDRRLAGVVRCFTVEAVADDVADGARAEAGVRDGT